MKPWAAFLLAAAVSLPLAAYATSYNDKTAAEEGGSSYSVFNRNGGSAVGRYQITAGTWAQLGYFQYAGSGSKSDWSNYVATAKAEAAGVDSLDELRFTSAGAALQDQANTELAARNWAALSSATRGLVGETVNGVEITEDGLLGAAHFLGAGALNDWVASGFDPRALPADYLKANGFTSYAELQDAVLGRIAAMNGGSYDGSAVAAAGASGGMYGRTEGFPGIGGRRPILIREVPPFQGEKATL
ncbi:MAG TPA: hypothetical protein VFJ18_11210 [Pararhizobium sp.]|nr:hypothetical protein [Pararhizobium sp.]